MIERGAIIGDRMAVSKEEGFIMVLLRSKAFLSALLGQLFGADESICSFYL